MSEQEIKWAKIQNGVLLSTSLFLILFVLSCFIGDQFYFQADLAVAAASSASASSEQVALSSYQDAYIFWYGSYGMVQVVVVWILYSLVEIGLMVFGAFGFRFSKKSQSLLNRSSYDEVRPSAVFTIVVAGISLIPVIWLPIHFKLYGLMTFGVLPFAAIAYSVFLLVKVKETPIKPFCVNEKKISEFSFRDLFDFAS
jgi:hypothetical protein